MSVENLAKYSTSLILTSIITNVILIAIIKPKNAVMILGKNILLITNNPLTPPKLEKIHQSGSGKMAKKLDNDSMNNGNNINFTMIFFLLLC